MSSECDVKLLVSEYHQLGRVCKNSQTKIFLATNRRERILEEIAKKITISPAIIRIGSQSFVIESGIGKTATIRPATKIT